MHWWKKVSPTDTNLFLPHNPTLLLGCKQGKSYQWFQMYTFLFSSNYFPVFNPRCRSFGTKGYPCLECRWILLDCCRKPVSLLYFYHCLSVSPTPSCISLHLFEYRQKLSWFLVSSSIFSTLSLAIISSFVTHLLTRFTQLLLTIAGTIFTIRVHLSYEPLCFSSPRHARMSTWPWLADLVCHSARSLSLQSLLLPIFSFNTAYPGCSVYKIRNKKRYGKEGKMGWHEARYWLEWKKQSLL